jgi:protein-L-isoaspartate(D-aspartate) O-methyltransferase
MLEIVSYRNPVKVILGVILISSCICLPVEPVKADDLFQAERDKMIRLIEQDVLETSVYLKRSSLDTRVLDAMARVPRHEFVPTDLVDRAYLNRPLPIGHGQTISQPYIVAIMTDLLDLKPHHKVLEIGTGSGYQAAVLAALDTPSVLIVSRYASAMATMAGRSMHPLMQSSLPPPRTIFHRPW